MKSLTGKQRFMEKVDKVLQDADFNLETEESIGSVTIKIAEIAIDHFRTIHSKALGCHCECLGMNAENCIASCKGDTKVPFNKDEYKKVMTKWELIDKKGNPIIQ